MSGDAGYLLVADAADARDPAVEAALAALLRSGWTLRLDGFGLRILTGPRFPWPVAQVHRAHALIGNGAGRARILPRSQAASPKDARSARAS